MEEYIIVHKTNYLLIENKLDRLIFEITKGHCSHLYLSSSNDYFHLNPYLFIKFPKDIDLEDLKKELQDCVLLKEII